MADERLRQAIREALKEGRLPCTAAFCLAEEARVTPAEVGRVTDELDIRISRCQLGLFGYGPKEEGKHRVVKPLPTVPPQLSEEIRARLQEGRLPCAAAWQIAKRTGMAKLEVSGAAEALEVRISRCQLGCF